MLNEADNDYIKEEDRVMKKILICLAAIAAVSCENATTRHLGGTMTIDVEPGYKVINATFKYEEIWYFVEPMDSNYTPSQKKLVEKSMYGVFEGAIIFQRTQISGIVMTIETKYNIGYEVWWYWAGSCVPATGVITVFWHKEDICYAQIVNKEMPVNIEVNRLFPTKEELLKSL